jgi:hypothetical protein
MFKQGEIVKSKQRYPDFPKFVMVLFDKSPSETQFNGVVIFCKSNNDELDEDEEAGYETNVWNTEFFEKSSWEELKKWI